MVPNSRTALGPGALRSVNLPRPLDVRVGENGMLLAIRLKAGWVEIDAVEETWEVYTEWWRETPVTRDYHTVWLEHGRRFTLFHDLVTDVWYAQHI